MFKELNVLKIFFEEPTREYNVREMARILKIAPATASKELKKMAKAGFLKEREERILILYSANLEGELYKDTKIYYNIRKLKESGLIDALNKFYLKPTIFLFGSSSYGEDIEASDLDLLIISEKTKEFPKTKEFDKKLNRKVQIFAVKDIKDIKNKHLINNIINGVHIQGEIIWT